MISLAAGQRLGAMTLLVACLTVYAVAVFSRQWPEHLVEVPWGAQGESDTVIEIALGGPQDGIYFLAGQEPAEALLRLTGLAERLSPPEAAELRRLERRSYRVSLTPEGALLGPLSAATALTLGLPIDLNHAAWEDLILLPGIGEKTAAAIVAHRSRQGAFRSLADLAQVPGIKAGRLKSLGPYLQVDGQER